MFTSVAHARQMSGIATSTITRFLITHPEYAGAANANKPLPMNMIYDHGGDYGWSLFWNKSSAILPISDNELNFLYEFMREKNVEFTSVPLPPNAAHSARVEAARSMMDALPRELHAEMYEAMAKKMNPTGIQPAEGGPIDELEPFQARGATPVKQAQDDSKKSEAKTEAVAHEDAKEPSIDPKVHSALVKIARTFVCQQKHALPPRMQETSTWIGETIRGVVQPLSLTNKQRAELIALLDGDD